MKFKYHYILEGHKVVPEPDPVAWSRWFNDNDRTVAKTEVAGAEVSTVFLGLDHGFFQRLPLVFETMIFGGTYDGYVARYSTWQDAEEGHQRVVECLQKGEDPDDDISAAARVEVEQEPPSSVEDLEDIYGDEEESL